MEKKEKGLSVWQLTMLALGTVVGGSFFLGSAVALHAAGPSIVLAFAFGGILVYFILSALSEMTVASPVEGSFRSYAARAFGQGTGFVVGWVYWTGMILGMSSEATAASILIRTWLPGLPLSVLGSAIILAVTLLNLLGTDKLSNLESGLAAIKLFAIISFIFLALALIAGLLPGLPPVGAGSLAGEPFFAGGIPGLAGSMLIVMFSYSGFEIIGLAASETSRPRETIPKAIRYTVICLVSLYIVAVGLILPLIPTAALNENTSPIVAALDGRGIGWAGAAINIVLITAILSTMLATMFGLGRTIRSLAEEGLAPKWLWENKDVPRRGILFSGLCMLLALGLGLLFPRVYLFLLSAGGFSVLFTYAAIMATHIRLHKKTGCPPGGKYQIWGFPYTSVFTLAALLTAIASMPFVPGQASGLVAGGIIVLFFILYYAAYRLARGGKKTFETRRMRYFRKTQPELAAELSRELSSLSPRETGAMDGGPLGD
ncbi:MAG: amino acid permease, partial [Oscillospiraceae bacterium]|nr:amino acid permease [Oscillospiraceae bacterium]